MNFSFHYISIFQLIALNIFYKQHIKTYVLSKTIKISPTCFGHLATILREIQYLSLLQLLNYRCSSMPAAMCVLGPVLSCDCYAFSGMTSFHVEMFDLPRDIQWHIFSLV